jgi:hypothetical protein
MTKQRNGIQKRHGRYYFRCRIPADLVKVYGKNELKKALGTSSPQEAKLRAAKIAVILGTAFNRLRTMDIDQEER